MPRMTTLAFFLAACAAFAGFASASNSWAGTSSYFIQGMSTQAQDNYIKRLADDGAKVLRVWVNGAQAGHCEKGQKYAYSFTKLEQNELGNWENDASLDYLDQTLVKLGQHGLKAIVSIHDANVLSGQNGNDAYAHYGSSFYSDSSVASAFDKRIQHILSYEGRYSGRVWGNYSSVIMAFDIQNEPFQGFNEQCRAGTNQFLCDRANTFRQALGAQNPIKIATGGIGGDDSHGCSFMKSAVECATMDMISVHRYGGDDDSFITVAKNYVQKAKQAGKLLVIEEFGVQKSFSNGFNAQADDITSAGVPWVYWEVVPTPDSGCDRGDDGFTLYYGDANFDAKTAFGHATAKKAAQDWTGIIY